MGSERSWEPIPAMFIEGIELEFERSGGFAPVTVSRVVAMAGLVLDPSIGSPHRRPHAHITNGELMLAAEWDCEAIFELAVRVSEELLIGDRYN